MRADATDASQARGIKRSLAALALVLLALGHACSGEEGTLRTVEPVYDNPCIFIAADACSSKGECHADELGVPGCLCQVGYGGANCQTCERGFHLDARELCITDRSCRDQKPDPCGKDGACSDSSGVISCKCDTGYGGPRCTLCATGYARAAGGRCVVDTRGPSSINAAGGMDAGTTVRVDGGAAMATKDSGQPRPAPIDTDCPASARKRVTTTLGFEKMSSWPTLDNQCDALGELTQGPLTMKSRVGSTSGYVWACARRTSYPQAIDSPHIELEAAALATAQLSFPLPVYSIRFDYGAPKGALALDVLVDSNTVQTIDLAKFGRAKFELQLSAPATLIALRSRSAYLQTIAIDNLEFQSDQCPQETPQ